MTTMTTTTTTTTTMTVACHSEREVLRELSHDLVREFEGHVPAGSVLRCITRCRRELVRAGVHHGLSDATAAMARARLRFRRDGLPPAAFRPPWGHLSADGPSLV